MPSNGDHITFVIPYWVGATGLVRDSVKSALNQTHSNLTVLVMNDGDVPGPRGQLAGIDDPRLVVADVPKRLGCFFAREVGRIAAPGPYVAFLDADDRVMHRWSTMLLKEIREQEVGGAVSRFRYYKDGKYTSKDPRMSFDLKFQPWERPLSTRLIHRRSNVGIFSKDALAAIGGVYGGLTQMWDMYMMNCLLVTSGVAQVHSQLYVQGIHQGQTTQSGEIPYGSDGERSIRAFLQERWDEVWAVFEADGQQLHDPEVAQAAARGGRIIGNQRARALIDPLASHVQELLAKSLEASSDLRDSSTLQVKI